VPLAPGNYVLNLQVRVGGETADWIKGAYVLSVLPRDVLGSGRTPVPSKLWVPYRWEDRDLSGDAILPPQNA
jgi:hypothetical protein